MVSQAGCDGLVYVLTVCADGTSIGHASIFSGSTLDQARSKKAICAERIKTVRALLAEVEADMEMEESWTRQSLQDNEPGNSTLTRQPRELDQSASRMPMDH